MDRYIAYLRKRPKHIQQLHAIFFASGVSLVMVVYVLYTDYGFWHERYVKVETDILNTVKAPVVPDSPVGALGRFLGDAKAQLEGMKIDTSFLEGKEVYIKPE